MPIAAGLYYEDHGARDAPPLILSAGMGGSAHYWRPNIAALAAHFRVIVYDHRGTGRSDPAASGTIEDIGADIGALMDAIGVGRAAIVGHAIGGMGALCLAIDAPDRIERIVVVNGWGRLDAYTARCFDARLALLRRAGARAYLDAQPIFLYPPQWISDHHAMLVEETDRLAADFPAAMIERRILAARRFAFDDRLRRIVQPVLLVASADDALVPPACSAGLAGAIADARTVSMAWGGHACNVTDPAAFDRVVIDFLGS